MLLNGLQSSVNSAGDAFRVATATPEGQVLTAAKRVQDSGLSEDDLFLISNHLKDPLNAAWYLGLTDDRAKNYVECTLRSFQAPESSPHRPL